MATTRMRLLMVLLPIYLALSRVRGLPTKNTYSIRSSSENPPDSSSARPRCVVKTLAKRMEITLAEEVRPKTAHDTIHSEDETPSSSTRDYKQDLASSKTWDGKQDSASSSTPDAFSATLSLESKNRKPLQEWILEHPGLSIDDEVPFKFDTVRRDFLEAYQRFYFAELRFESRGVTLESSGYHAYLSPLYRKVKKTLEELLQIEPRLLEQDRALRSFEDQFFEWFNDNMDLDLSRPQSVFQGVLENFFLCVSSSEKTLTERKADQILARRKKLLDVIYEELNPEYPHKQIKSVTERWNLYRPLLNVQLEKANGEMLWQRVIEKFKLKPSLAIGETELKRRMFEHIKFAVIEFRQLWDSAKIPFLELIAIQKMVLEREPVSFKQLRELSTGFSRIANLEQIKI